MRKTKIVATLGPATDNDEILRSLFEQGLNVARFNMSHGNHDQHRERFEKVKKLREELKLPVATLLDTKGPEIRTGLFDGVVTLTEGEKFTLTTRELIGNSGICSITYKHLPQDIKPGQRILIADGLIELRVDEIIDTEIICTIIDGGEVSSNKGINCPDVHLSMPYISDRDRVDIRFGKETGFDYIAASFVRSAEDIKLLRKELETVGWDDVRVIAKIENAEGVENIDEIIALSDGIMIARGDMGVEIEMQEIPVIQKRLIKKAAGAGRQVITATQMLESMVKNPRPTRAEATDVANAIYDGTSAIMLSGETAAGKYPVEALRTMAIIAERTEADIHYENRFRNFVDTNCRDITTAISHATVTTAYDLKAKSIITVTKSGYTVRMVSRFRPACGIVGCTPSEKVYNQLSLSWGVQPLLVEEVTSTDELFATAAGAALENRLLEKGDVAVITAGVPIGISGSTNLLKVQTI